MNKPRDNARLKGERSLSLPLEIVILGSASSGKTSLVQYFLHQKFIPELTSDTNGAVYYSKTVPIGTDNYKFKIWDTSADEKYKFLLPMYYKTAKAAIVVYNADKDSDSFNKAKELVVELRKEENSIVIGFVASKTDLGNVIPTIEVNEFSRLHDLIALQTSSKNGTSVIELFEQIAVACKQTYEYQNTPLQVNQCNILGVNNILSPTNPSELIRSIELVNANSFLVERDSVHVIDKEFAPSSSENSKKEKLIESEVDVDAAIKSKRPEWANDDAVKECFKCAATFSVFFRKHHCRACGNIFCSDCSSHFATIPQLAYHKPVRVCVDCHGRLLH